MRGSISGILVFGMVLLSVAPLLAQTDYTVDLSEIEKEIEKIVEKPYSLGGFLEFNPVIFGLDRDSAFYRLRFFDDDQGNTLEQYNYGLRLEGSYKRGITSLFFRTNTLLRKDFEGWHDKTMLFEGNVSLKPSPGLSFDAGKKVVKWGKGYAWNPAAFVDRPKNPEDPEEALEGFYLLNTDIIRSFDGPLKTAALTTVLLPVYEDINEDFGAPGRINMAAKLYLLLYDTDIDFMVFTGGSRTTRYGFDFAKNLKTNLEIHGEWALIKHFEQMVINENGQGSLRKSDVYSYLIGIRYLTPQETTIILEYYHNGTGFRQKEAEDFYTFVDDSYGTFLSTGESTRIQQASRLARGAYGRPNPMRRYVYLRISQKEPFDILYFTPAITFISNVTDKSLTVIPELLYSPLTNLEARLRGALLVGHNHTEYGEKQNDYRVELRIRYYF